MKSIDKSESLVEPRGWVFYDGSCPICRGGVERFHQFLHQRGFALAPLQTPWVQKRLNLNPENLLDEMRVLTHDGRIVGGADGLIYLSGQVWWAWPFYLFAQLPLIRPLSWALYRWVAKNRYCISGTCSIHQPPEIPSISLWRLAAGWLPLILLPLLIISYQPFLIPWIFMWALSISMWMGFKWLTWWQVRIRRVVDIKRSLAYLFLWPGMDAAEFLFGKPLAKKPTSNAWLFAFGKTLVGASLFWGFARMFFPYHPLVAGWIGLFGLIFLMHFGTFNLIALFWQTLGLNAQPIMRNPLFAASLSDFWSHRWNLAFRQLAHRLAFQPLHKRIGPDAAMFVAFLGSGLIHELAISLPARGGYGLPTAYFVSQGLGLAVERSRFGKRFGLGKGFVGWAFTLLIAAGPAFWLFHPPFITRIVIPFMTAAGAL